MTDDETASIDAVPPPALYLRLAGAARDWAADVRPDGATVVWTGEDRTHHERVSAWWWGPCGVLTAVTPGGTVRWVSLTRAMAPLAGVPPDLLAGVVAARIGAY